MIVRSFAIARKYNINNIEYYMFKNIISKEYIDQNVRPFSGSDSLYGNSVREALMMDINPLIDEELASLMIVDAHSIAPGPKEEPSQEYTDLMNLLDEGLRMSLAYFTYSRAIRTADGTITKYGYTVKTNENSVSAESSKIVSDSTYYKTIGEKLLIEWMEAHPDHKRCPKGKVQNDAYLKCRVIGH